MDDIQIKSPLVSVIMPLYNKETEIKRAIDSVLNQTVSNFELIVINDGSMDRGPEIVRKYSDPRINILDQKNEGVSAARNRGIREASTDLIAFLDADDEWSPLFLETIFDLKNTFPDCKVYATSYLYCEENSKCRVPILRGVPHHPWKGILDNYFAIACKSDPPIWSSAVAVDKNAINSIGLFPVGVTSGEDLLTWAKLALQFKIAYASETCAIFHTPQGVSDRPHRFNSSSDRVGKELARLLKTATPSNMEPFKRYIAMWHKNRTVTFLELGENKKAKHELTKISIFSKKDIKWWIYTLLTVLPQRITPHLIKKIKQLMRLRRARSRNSL